MPIRVERKPYVEVTEDDSGWSMRGGRSFADRSTTKEMDHSGGARCTVFLGPIDRDEHPGAIVEVLGVLYLNPDEQAGTTMRKLPGPGDFIGVSELYEVVSRLCVAWHEATYTNVAPMRVLLPSR